MPQTPTYTKSELYTDALQMMDRAGDTSIPIDLLVRKARAEMQKKHSFKAAETSLDVDLADGDESFDEPSDLREFYGLRLVSQADGSFVSQMTFIDKDQFDRLRPITDTTNAEGEIYVVGRSVDSSTPRLYTRFGGVVYIYPAASGSDQRIVVDYLKFFPNSIADKADDYTDGLLNFMDLSLAATCWQIALFLKDADAIQLWSGEYARLMQDQIETDNYDRDEPRGQWGHSRITQ